MAERTQRTAHLVPPTSSRHHICIVAHFAYGAMTGGTQGHIGGVERQTTLTARWLANRGYRVSLLTWWEGPPGDEEIDGIRVIKMCRKDTGMPGLRFFHPRWTSLVQGLSRADADVYYQNCAEYVTGQVALWCRLNRRRFVYSVASDPDCDANLPRMRAWHERALYRIGIQKANHIIAQTLHQQTMMRNNFGRNAEVIPMPCPGPNADWVAPSLHDRAPKRILWVGRIAPVKRLELLLDIAESAPDLVFDVVGPLEHEAYAMAQAVRAKTLSNVVLHGGVPRATMPQFYMKNAILCCTSAYEGFPNTFLEAWSYGMPIVSTVDPDNLLTKHHTGSIGNNQYDLLQSIRTIIGDYTIWNNASFNSRRYFLENHIEEKIFPKFESALFQL